MLNIYTVKWGTKYSTEHVNKIFTQCKKQTSKKFRFFCLTEDGSNLIDDIEVIPFPENNYYEKWWNKLYLFDKNVVTQSGEKLFLDLDIYLQHNIDPIIDHNPKDCLTFVRTHWHNLEQMKIDTKDNPRLFTDLNSSVLRWNDSLDTEKITKFVRDYPDQMFFYYRGLDNLFGHQRERLLNIDYFPDGWVYSYNYGYMWPDDIEERVMRKKPIVRLYDSMERPEDVKL
jgi:hypothetical protein